MDIELLKLLPGGGSVIGVIIVVMMFLRQQAATAAALATFADKLNTHLTESQRAWQSQINTLFSDYVQVSKEQVAALKQLEALIRSLRPAEHEAK
jgi:ABC-type transporter Mla subunit MlaD